MLALLELLIIVLVLIVTYWFLTANKRPKKYPPGPNGIPIFGYIPFMNSVAPHKTITTLSKTYGDVFSLKLGSRDVVYLNSYDSAKEAFNHPHFQGRPDFASFKLVGPSFLTSDGPFWELHRRFTIRHLKDFGFGKACLEQAIGREAEKLVKRFREKNEQPFQMSTDLNITILNIIWHMIAGLTFHETDPDCELLLNNAKKSVEAFSSCFLADFLTWGPKVLPKSITKLGDIELLVNGLDGFLQKLIDEHNKSLDVDNPRDFMDVFLTRMRKEEKEKGKDSWFRYDVLKANMVDLFVAGSETTATTIKAAILLLTQNPDAQEKLKQDIQEITGGKRRVCLEDRKSLPYLEAVIMESQRHCSITPFGLPHYTTENSNLGQFQIPKGTVVLANYWAIHLHEKHWADPTKFDPNRFLNEDGSVNYKKEGFMPFSLGKRQCLGEQLAKAELFLFLGYLVQDFTFSTPSEAPPVSVYDATGGVVIHTPPFDIIAKANN